MAIKLKRIEKEETEVVSLRVNKSVAREWNDTIRRVGLQKYNVRDINNNMLVNTTADLKKALTGDDLTQIQNGSVITDR